MIRADAAERHAGRSKAPSARRVQRVGDGLGVAGDHARARLDRSGRMLFFTAAMKLVIFDCDGTLVDSQHAICAAMEHAFATLGLRSPSRRDMLGVVGLSLPQVFAVLAGEQPASVQAELIRLVSHRLSRASAKERSRTIRCMTASARWCKPSPRRDDMVLGIATGKSRRGVARILEREGWHGHFLTIQTADDHPSKPHPSMILRAMIGGRRRSRLHPDGRRHHLRHRDGLQRQGGCRGRRLGLS